MSDVVKAVLENNLNQHASNYRRAEELAEKARLQLLSANAEVVRRRGDVLDLWAAYQKAGGVLEDLAGYAQPTVQSLIG